MAWVEPGFASVERRAGSEVHGVAFLMTVGSEAQLDRAERGYNKAAVTLDAYDGRQLAGFVYVPRQERAEQFLPSQRYLAVLVKGAVQAGLKEEYIARLRALPAYDSRQETAVVAARVARARLAGRLPLVTVTQLAEHRTGDTWVSVLGLVVRQTSYFASHSGRDITSRVLMQFHGIPLDDNDDRGRPPFPLVSQLSQAELEFCLCWLDHYQLGGQAGAGEVVAELAEFQQQQQAGTTTFALPPVPQL